MREILFKLSGAVTADKGVGQRARCKVGVWIICYFTFSYVISAEENIGEFF
ncbi:hypothetical protein AB300_001340 [Salmonella enterica subsp. enterica serovar Meleagridis]|nr:hypothetical protein [Salmonella enterica subsp. enterica serovar Meleagridis]